MSTRCKVVFLGGPGVGKTSLLKRLVLDSFDKDYSSTIGVEFFTKPVQVGDKTINLQIWDTAGQERFKSLIPGYVRDTSVAVIVYDVSYEESLEEAKYWYQVVLNERGSDAICILVGNKIDLESRVMHSKVLDFARPIGMTALETSAKTGQNVTRLFRIISELSLDKAKVQSTSVVVDLSTSQVKPAKQSCTDC